MKCPKCDEEMTGQPSACLDCGLLVDTQEFDDAVNALLDLATEEDEDAGLGW